MLFLLMADAQQRLIVLTETDMFKLCQNEKKNGRVPREVEFLHAELPEELARSLHEARETASREVTPPRESQSREMPNNKFQIWIEAKKKYHLTDAQIQMARELGLNPKKFGGLANTRQEPWKKPLSEFIEELYIKRFKKPQPDVIKRLNE